MIDWTKPIELMTLSELREILASGRLSPRAREEVIELIRLREINGVKVQKQQSKATERAKVKWARIKHTEIGANMRVASVVNSGKNAAWTGGGLITFATIQQIIEVYAKLEEHDLLPLGVLKKSIAVLREMHFTDEQIVYTLAGMILVGVGTFGWKILKHWDV